MPTHICNYAYRTCMSRFTISEIQDSFIFRVLNTLEYASSFIFIFANFSEFLQ